MVQSAPFEALPDPEVREQVPTLPLLSEALRAAMAGVVDRPEVWLVTENLGFGGKTPLQVIQAGDEEWVLDRLRGIRYGIFS